MIKQVAMEFMESDALSEIQKMINAGWRVVCMTSPSYTSQYIIVVFEAEVKPKKEDK